MITSSTPWPRSHSSMKAMNGRSDERHDRLGDGRGQRPQARALAAGEDHRLHQLTACRSPRSVSPAARDRRSASRALRPSITQRRRAIALGDLAPVELDELRPLGHEHDRVGVRRRASSAESANSSSGISLRASLLGDRVIRADLRALGLQPGGEHERGGLAHVVGVRA